MSWSLFFQEDKQTSAGSSRPSSALRVEHLEDRTVPVAALNFTTPFTPNGFGGGNFNPFPGFTGQVNVTSADLTGDGVPDIIAAQGVGPGSASEVRVFDGASARFNARAVLVADFFAYSSTPGAGQTPGFGGGVFVAAGNFDGGSTAELVTSTGAGGGGHIKIFDFRDPATGQFLGSNPIVRTSFFAYPGYAGDVRVAVLPQANGVPFLVTSSGPGTTASDIRLYADPLGIGSVPSGELAPPALQTFVFPGYLGGVSIAAASSPNRDGSSDLFVSTNTGVPTVTAFRLATSSSGTPTLVQLATFQPTAAPQTDIRIDAADVTGSGSAELLVSFINPTGVSPVQVYSVNPGNITQVTTLNNFQGFGFFSNQWVSSETLAGPMVVQGPAFTSQVVPFTNSGLTGFGTTGLTGFTNTGLTGFGTTGLTGFGTTGVLTGVGTTGLTGFGNTGLTGFGNTGLAGFGMTPFFGNINAGFGTGSTALPSQNLSTMIPILTTPQNNLPIAPGVI